MKKYLKQVIQGLCIVLVAAIAIVLLSLFDKLEVREGSNNDRVIGSWYIMPVEPIPEIEPESEEVLLCYYAEFREDGTGLWYECEYPPKSMEDVTSVEPREVKSFSFSDDYGLEFIRENPLTGKDKLEKFSSKYRWSFRFENGKSNSFIMEKTEDDEVTSRYEWSKAD